MPFPISFRGRPAQECSFEVKSSAGVIGRGKLDVEALDDVSCASSSCSRIWSNTSLVVSDVRLLVDEPKLDVDARVEDTPLRYESVEVLLLVLFRSEE